jgi:hypothetical protein
MTMVGILACVILTPSARAQFIGFSSPQSVQTTLATNQACTGSLQTFTVPNLGQTQHFVQVVSANLGTMQVEIDGQVAGPNLYRISDVLKLPSITGVTSGSLTGSGYFPLTAVLVTCTGSGTFQLTYSGTSSTSTPNVGSYQIGQINKLLANVVTAAANATSNFQTPFGNAYGEITFIFLGTGPSGSTLTMQCQGSQEQTNFQQVFPLVTTNLALQTFYVAPQTCPFAIVTYTAGGASANNYTLEYVFSQPGFGAANLASYAHITGTTATAVKATPGIFLSLNVNTAAAGTVSVFDLATAACTATPSTNTVAVVTVNATDPAYTKEFNIPLLNGIFVKASVAMDLTVGYQ